MDLQKLTGRRVFTRPEAYAAGLSRRDFDAAVKAEAILNRRRTVFATAAAVAAAATDPARAHALEVEALMRALSRVHIAAAGASAGIIHRLEFVQPPPKRLIVCSPDPGVHGTRRSGYDLRPAPLPDDHVVRREHVPVTSVARTLLDLGSEMPFAHGLATVDAARRDRLVTMPELRAVLAWGAGRPNIEAARKALLLSDPLSESVLESISRAGMYEQGVPIPRLQVEVFTPFGEFVARVDFMWDLPVIGDPDGMKKFVVPGTELVRLSVVKNYLTRHEALVDMDFEVVRWGWDLANDPPRLAARLFAAFERAEARLAGRRVRSFGRAC